MVQRPMSLRLPTGRDRWSRRPPTRDSRECDRGNAAPSTERDRRHRRTALNGEATRYILFGHACACRLSGQLYLHAMDRPYLADTNRSRTPVCTDSESNPSTEPVVPGTDSSRESDARSLADGVRASPRAATHHISLPFTALSGSGCVLRRATVIARQQRGNASLN
jgi:hypothetical protein